MWKLAYKGLNLRKNLIRRGIPINEATCMHGCDCKEDEIHVFFTCPFAKRLWFASHWGIRWRVPANDEVINYLHQIWNHDFLGLKTKKEIKDVILFSVTIIELI